MLISQNIKTNNSDRIQDTLLDNFVSSHEVIILSQSLNDKNYVEFIPWIMKGFLRAYRYKPGNYIKIRLTDKGLRYLKEKFEAHQKYYERNIDLDYCNRYPVDILSPQNVIHYGPEA